jgi:hypothetical protein
MIYSEPQLEKWLALDPGSSPANAEEAKRVIRLLVEHVRWLYRDWGADAHLRHHRDASDPTGPSSIH